MALQCIDTPYSASNAKIKPFTCCFPIHSVVVSLGLNAQFLRQPENLYFGHPHVTTCNYVSLHFYLSTFHESPPLSSWKSVPLVMASIHHLSSEVLRFLPAEGAGFLLYLRASADLHLTCSPVDYRSSTSSSGCTANSGWPGGVLQRVCGVQTMSPGSLLALPVLASENLWAWGLESFFSRFIAVYYLETLMHFLPSSPQFLFMLKFEKNRPPSLSVVSAYL